MQSGRRLGGQRALVMSNGSRAPEYIRSTYKCQDGRKDATFERGVLWSHNQGLPGEEVRLGDGAFSSSRMNKVPRAQTDVSAVGCLR